MALRIAANDVAKRALFARYVSASTPQVDPGEGWAVDGFVRTADGTPVAGVTVAAYDRQNHWYKELRYGCTDEAGYFSILVETLPDKELTVFMRASKGRQLLPADPVQLSPTRGSADRVEIIISDDTAQSDCVPPSGRGETRPPKVKPRDKATPASSTKEDATLRAKPDQPAPGLDASGDASTAMA